MQKFIRSTQFPFIATCAGCFALVGFSVILAQTFNLAACPLCIIQRMLYLLLGVAGGIGIIVANSLAGRRLAATAMAAIAGTGIFVAGYHVWIQRFARHIKCTADTPWWEELVDWAGERIPVLFQATGQCVDDTWKMFGFSIAELSLIAFTGLLLFALFAGLRRT